MEYLRISFLLFFSSFFSLALFAQQPVKGSLHSDTLELAVIRTFPGEFPQLSIVFEVQDKLGNPMWDLTPDMLTVKEDEVVCDIIDLSHVSEKKKVNMGMIIDHSGSMRMGVDFATFLEMHQNGTIDDYVNPMEAAKKAASTLVNQLNTSKDAIQIIGFSTTVDQVSKLSNDTTYLQAQIDSLKPTGTTAFYDAIDRGLDELENEEGINALIALTDGLDNESKLHYNKVIEKAQKLKIPVYVVGLGENIQKASLDSIASLTNAKFYYAKSADEILEIYETINQRILSIYELTYMSENYASIDSEREIKIEFAVDSLYLADNDLSINLPEEVVTVLKQKERNKQLMWGGILFGIVAVLGAVVIVRRNSQKKKTPKILNIFPNPSDGDVNVDLDLAGDLASKIIVRDMKGQVLMQQAAMSGTQSLNLKHLDAGTYVLTVQGTQLQSESKQLILTK